MPLRTDQIDRLLSEKLQLSQESESNGTAGPKSREISRDRGAFFSVMIPKGLGPMHILRLIISYLSEGRIKDEVFILIIYDMLERVFHTAERNRDFRKKWRRVLKALVLLSKALPLITRNLDSVSKVRYIISNRLNQEINFLNFLIPLSERNDEALEGIKVIRHERYTPPAKKSTKIPSNSQGTKGSYQPDSISWKEVASKETIWEKGRFVKVYEKPSKNAGDLIKC